jgi:hypothetical protein
MATHLRRILQSFADNYKKIRTHRSLDNDAPAFRRVPRVGNIASFAILGAFITTICGFEFSVQTGTSTVLKLTQRQSRAKELLWIHRLAIDPRFIMQMWPGGTVSRPNLADDFVDAHALADFDVDLGQMAKARDKSITMIDFHHVAVTALATGGRHAAGGCGEHRFAGGRLGNLAMGSV